MPTRTTVTDTDNDTDDSPDLNEAQLAKAVAELRSETNPNVSETAVMNPLNFYSFSSFK